MWSKEGIFADLNYRLTSLVDVHHGRSIHPTAFIMDKVSAKTFSSKVRIVPGRRLWELLVQLGGRRPAAPPVEPLPQESVHIVAVPIFQRLVFRR